MGPVFFYASSISVTWKQSNTYELRMQLFTVKVRNQKDPFGGENVHFL